MRVLVLGAGVIGVTSAYYLAAAGHDVVVVDRQPHAAMETSFANAGEISPGYASPWAAPDIPMKALRWLLMDHAPLILRPKLDIEMLRWLTAMLGNCTAARYAINKSRMVRLAEFSRDCLIDLRGKHSLTYDEGTRGTLQVFRSEQQLAGVAKDVEVLRAGGVPFELLNAAGCVAAEPGLHVVRFSIAGGLRLPNDETGDCFKFTRAVAAVAAGIGVRFEYDTTVERLMMEGDRVAGAYTDKGEFEADAVVIALGSYSPALVRPLGLRLPIYPVKGYSITVPVIDQAHAPISTIMDETYKVAITRLGDRIRVGGMAEISGFSKDLPKHRRRTLEHSLTGLFPLASTLSHASFWSGLRPMTPDGPPIVGPTAVQNLYLNTGHGTLGFTMACGSASILADIVSGRAPAIAAGDLTLERYG
jgi:D-amino-acid dehydrogenase